MSVRISLDKITNEHKKIITKQLFLQPKKTNFTANKFSNVEKDPVLFYWVDKPNNEIVLPYTFANILFQTHINSSLKFPAGKFNFKGKLRDNQIPVAEKALSQLFEKGTTTLALPTGFGKSILSTYLSSELIKNCQGIVLILTNRLPIQEGWFKTISRETDAGIWVVGDKVPSQCNIILSMDGRFQKIPKEIKKMISILVIDEAHLFSTSTKTPILLGTCPKYIIACSATLERTDGMHSMIENMVGKHKVEVKNNKKFKVIKVNTGIKTELVKNKMGTVDFSALTRDLSFNPKRNAIIIDFVEQNKQSKFMILSWSKDHCTLLYEILKKRGESVDILSGTKSKYFDSRILIGTISKISTGFDSANVAINFDGIAIDTLILAGSTKSHNLHIQSIGRVFRSDYPTIFELVDDNRISKSHWRARKKNYDEMNCEQEEYNIEKKVDPIETHNSRLEAYLNKNQNIHK